MHIGQTRMAAIRTNYCPEAVEALMNNWKNPNPYVSLTGVSSKERIFLFFLQKESLGLHQ